MSLTALVLAAGLGKRMKSKLPKVLHRAAGKPLLTYPMRAALEAGASELVLVVSPDIADAVRATFGSELGGAPIRIALQFEPRGTGDAARVGLREVKSGRVIVVYGDTPLLRPEDLRTLLGALTGSVEVALMSAMLDDPTGYGRVLRDEHGKVREVREHRDLRTDAERATREVNAGVYVARTDALTRAVGEIRDDNAQHEFYLTDVVALAAKRGGAVAIVGHPDNLHGVNDRSQLAHAEWLLYQRIAKKHQLAGVTVRGDARIDDGVEIGPDAVIESGVTVRGNCRIGAGATLDVGVVVSDSVIGERALIKPYSVVVESTVGAGAQIGPFAHLRPGSAIEDEAHIGNFVETKKTRVRKGAKANHLAYLGDGDIGEGANVGAGTIFCNYDGFSKHQTIIGPGAFIGSDSQIVAPVTIGRDAYVATGTTVTRDVPDEALAISRLPQQNKEGYAPRLKARLAAAAKKKAPGA
jgi:bifunctional UDP-N-acetylglucosamine pyrophosphorylase/glucosamine-1-phosphate N-acetyltransferase